MLTTNYLHSSLVLIFAFLLTAAAAVAMMNLFGRFFDTHSTRFGAALFVATVLVLLLSLYVLATIFLFDRNDRADVQVVGGARIGGGGAWMTGKTATWPFAKLSATRNALRLQTPWGDFAYGSGECGTLRRTGVIPGSWSICPGDHEDNGRLTFTALPWSAEQVERRLTKLGYKIE